MVLNNLCPNFPFNVVKNNQRTHTLRKMQQTIDVSHLLFWPFEIHYEAPVLCLSGNFFEGLPIAWLFHLCFGLQEKNVSFIAGLFSCMQIPCWVFSWVFCAVLRVQFITPCSLFNLLDFKHLNNWKLCKCYKLYCPPLLKASISKMKAKYDVLMVSSILCFPILSGSQGVEGSSMSCKQIRLLCKHIVEVIIQWEQFFALKLKKERRNEKWQKGREWKERARREENEKETERKECVSGIFKVGVEVKSYRSKSGRVVALISAISVRCRDWRLDLITMKIASTVW